MLFASKPVKTSLSVISDLEALLKKADKAEGEADSVRNLIDRDYDRILSADTDRQEAIDAFENAEAEKEIALEAFNGAYDAYSNSYEDVESSIKELNSIRYDIAVGLDNITKSMKSLGVDKNDVPAIAKAEGKLSSLDKVLQYLDEIEESPSV